MRRSIPIGRSSKVLDAGRVFFLDRIGEVRRTDRFNTTKRRSLVKEALSPFLGKRPTRELRKMEVGLTAMVDRAMDTVCVDDAEVTAS